MRRPREPACVLITYIRRVPHPVSLPWVHGMGQALTSSVGAFPSISFYQLRPCLPCLPALLHPRLSLLQGRNPVGASHWTIDVHGPEPSQIIWTAAGLIDAADIPLAAADNEVRRVLVDAAA